MVNAARLNGSATARAFTERLRLTLTMHELNGNEKYAALPSPANVGRIEKGDIMLSGFSTLLVPLHPPLQSYRTQ